MRGPSPIRRHVPPAVILAGLLVACGSPDRAEVAEEPTAFRPTTTDSAGVAIVDPGDLAAVRPLDLADADPRQVIGTPGAPGHDLFRVADVLLEPGGGLRVLDAGSSEVRRFGPAGDLVSVHGRPGEGPGEYRDPSRLFAYRGDSLAVFDRGLNRVSVLDPEGRYARSVSLLGSDHGSPADLHGVTADGGLMVSFGGASTSSGDSTRVERPDMMLVHLAPDGSDPVPVARFSGVETFVWANERSSAAGPLPFGRDAFAVLVPSPAGERVWIGENAGFRLEQRTLSGALERVLRWSGEPVPLPEEVAEAHRARRLAAIEGDFLREAREGPVRATPYPATHPPYTALVPGDDGLVWVQRSAERGPDGSASPAVWYAFAPDGALRRSVRLPAGFRLMAAGPGRLAGVVRDELDVEKVVVLELPGG